MTVRVAILLVGLAAGQAQPPVRDAPVKPPPGTAVISGVVYVGSAGDTPARRSRVVLTTTNPLNGHSVIAGDDGRFLFSNVPAGRYNLSVRRDGYVGTTYGARRPGGPGTLLVVAEGQRIPNLVVRIQKGAAITGTLTDRHGDRAADARVVLYRIRVIDGERRLEQAVSVTADDRGMYRAHSLAPGEYVLTAAAALRAGETGVRQLSEQELQAVYQPRSPAVGIAPIRPAASMGAPPPVAPPPLPALVSAPVFYPGVLLASQADPIRVAAGEERAGVDFATQLVPAGKIEGQVIDPGGRSDMTVTVTLNASSPMTVNPSRSVNIRMMEPGGTFTISGVLPGEYAIHAQARVTPAPPQTGLPAPPPVVLWGRTDVVTTGADMTGVAILLQPSLNLSGRVVLERTRPARPNDTGTIRVLLENFAPAGIGSAQRQLSATVGADGRFTLPGVGPGRYRLASLVSGPSGSDWVLKSAVLNGQNAMDLPVEIHPGDAPGETILTLTDRGTELTGHLLDQAGRPAPSHFVVVLAADRSMWLRGSRRQVSVRPASDGQYSVRNLPPGEYLIAAVTDMDIADLSDTAFLEMLVPAAMKVTLREGERKVQELRVGG